MHTTVQRIFDIGVIPPNWLVGLINSVAKVTGVPQVEQLRPMALQNVILKWFSNIMFIMLEPCIDYLVPLSQKRSIRGRKIFEHMWDTLVGCFHMEHGAFLSVDFSIQFNFCIAVFQVMGIPQFLIQVILALLRGPRKYIVNGQIVHEIMHVPESGIRQGDPLSPYLFVLMVSPLLYDLHQHCPSAAPRMYVDDLALIFTGQSTYVHAMVMQVVHRLRIFSKLSRLKMNVDKSKLLLKGDLSPADYRDTQLLIVSKLKYLGVWIGHITTEQAFAECLAIALQRAQFLRKLPLGFNERVLILKIWILPLLNFTAPAYQPYDSVISQLRNIYWVGLKLTNWSVTLPILSESQPGKEGTTFYSQRHTCIGSLHTCLSASLGNHTNYRPTLCSQ